MNSIQYIVFTGGGSGGHVFPGLAVWEALQKRDICNCLWIGSHTGPEKSMSAKYGIPFYSIATGKLRRYFSFKNVSDIYYIIMGIFQARQLLKKHNVQYVISTGGFVSFPVVFAAWTLRIPVASIILDISMSLANKLNKPFSSALFFSYLSTMDIIKSKSQKIYSAYPVRSQIYEANPKYIEQAYNVKVYNSKISKKNGTDIKNKKREYEYQKNKKIIFCVGGSLGATQINDVVIHLRKMLSDDVIIFHQTGRQLTYTEDTLQVSNEAHNEIFSENITYIKKDFFSQDYAHILAASDIVLSRAGSGSIWECIVRACPTLLLPLSLASSRGDQIENAAYFAKKGAVIDLGTHMSCQGIANVIQSLLYDTDKQKELSVVCRSILPHHKSADIIADYVVSCI